MRRNKIKAYEIYQKCPYCNIDLKKHNGFDHSYQSWVCGNCNYRPPKEIFISLDVFVDI